MEMPFLRGDLTGHYMVNWHRTIQWWNMKLPKSGTNGKAWGPTLARQPELRWSAFTVGKPHDGILWCGTFRSLSSFSSSSTPLFKAIGDDMQWHGWNSETLGICTLKGSTPSPAVIKSPSIRLWRCLALSWSRKCLQPSWINKSGDEKDLSYIMFYDMMCPTSWVAKPAFVSKWSGDSLRPIFRVTRPACNPSNLILTTKRRCSRKKSLRSQQRQQLLQQQTHHLEHQVKWCKIMM